MAVRYTGVVIFWPAKTATSRTNERRVLTPRQCAHSLLYKFSHIKPPEGWLSVGVSIGRCRLRTSQSQRCVGPRYLGAKSCRSISPRQPVSLRAISQSRVVSLSFRSESLPGLPGPCDCPTSSVASRQPTADYLEVVAHHGWEPPWIASSWALPVPMPDNSPAHAKFLSRNSQHDRSDLQL
jgi:hypothetical protein